MTDARSHEADRTTQAEFEAFYLRTARTLHGYLCRLSRDPATGGRSPTGSLCPVD